MHTRRKILKWAAAGIAAITGGVFAREGPEVYLEDVDVVAGDEEFMLVHGHECGLITFKGDAEDLHLRPGEWITVMRKDASWEVVELGYSPVMHA